MVNNWICIDECSDKNVNGLCVNAARKVKAERKQQNHEENKQQKMGATMSCCVLYIGLLAGMGGSDLCVNV